MPSGLVRGLRPAKAESPSRPILVLLHGLGSNEEDLLSLAPAVDPRYTVISLRAPIRLPYGGYAWFEITWDGGTMDYNQDQATQSLALIQNELAEIAKEYEVVESEIVIGGFSQGAMLSLGVHSQDPFARRGVLLMSGAPVPEFLAEPSAEANKTPILVQHGREDGLLPVALGRELRDALEARGENVKYLEYPMGHEVSLESLRDATAWLAARIAR